MKNITVTYRKKGSMLTVERIVDVRVEEKSPDIGAVIRTVDLDGIPQLWIVRSVRVVADNICIREYTAWVEEHQDAMVDLLMHMYNL